jgi:hypothetical protein
MQHLNEEDAETSVKNGRTADRLSFIETGYDPKDSGYDLCEVEVPKLSKVL